MVDMAHFAGLVAGKVLQGDFDPIPHAQIVTTTTHKTLRGPRGGLVLCNRELKDARRPRLPAGAGRPAAARDGGQDRRLHRGLAPGIQHVCPPDRRQCPGAWRSVRAAGAEGPYRRNRQPLARPRRRLDPRHHRPPGRRRRRRCGITLNRNPIPFDLNGPWYTSGLRFGAAAVTTLGMGKAEMDEIAAVVALVLKHIKPATTKSGAVDKTKYTLDETIRGQAHARVNDLLKSYPLYPEIDLPFLLEGLGMH